MTNSTHCTLLAKQACTTLSHVVQKITPPSANNFLKLFFALFAMLALGVGNAWGADFTLTSANSVTVDGVTVTFAKGNGATAPTWYTAGLRLYAQNTVTITSESEITSIVFDWEKQGSKTFASVSANTGSYSHPSAAEKGTWTGSSKSVIFTLASTSGVQLQLNTLSVTTAGSTTPKQNYTLTYQAGSVTGSLEVEEGANLLDALKDITPVACDPTSTEPIGWSESEITTKQANAPTLLTDADVMPSEEHSVYYVFAKKETVGGGAATEKTGTYTFSNYTAGTQNAKNEEHKLDDDVTIYTNDCHFTSELRIYSSSSNNGYVISNELPGRIISMDFNMGYKKDVLAVYGSTNGSDWTLVGSIATTATTYKDYTLSFEENNYTYFKLDVYGDQQIRIAKMSITYMSGGGTTTISDYTTSCSGSTEPVLPVTDEQLKWSAATATALKGADNNEFPTLTNELSVPVTYTSSNASVATIAADGSITLVAPGTTTISAAFAGGEVNGTKYAAKTVTYTLTVKQLVSCADIYNLADDATFVLKDFVVTYVNDKYTYIKDKDDTGYGLIFNNAGAYGLKAGDQVASGKFEGKKTTYRTLVEIIPITACGDLNATSGEAPAPNVLNTNPTTDNINQYVKFKKVSFDADKFNSSKSINGTIEGQSIAIKFYNQFAIEKTFDISKKYSVVGIVSIFDNNLQVYFISAEEVAEPTLNVDITNADFGKIAINGKAERTLTLNGSLLTNAVSLAIEGEDAEYFTLASESVTPTEGTITEAKIKIYYQPTAEGTHTATLKITSDDVAEQITLTGQAVQQHTVHFFVNGEEDETLAKKVLSDNTLEELPTATSCDLLNYPTFAGWTSAEIDGTTDVKPTMLDISTPITSDCNYYAVFEKGTTSSGSTTSAIMKYTGGETTNMKDGNNASTVGLDEALFTITSDKGGQGNHVGLNKAGDIRLYANKTDGNGNILTIAMAEGYTITQISLGIKQNATFVVKANGQFITGTENVYDINHSSCSIQNTTTDATTQLQLNSITISYTTSTISKEYLTTCESATPTYTVTYDLDDGESTCETSVVVEQNGELTLCDAPTKTGHTFLKWKDQSDNEYEAGATITVSSNLTLTAQWQKESYKVTWMSLGAEVASANVEYNAQPTKPAEDPTYTCLSGIKEFVGWTTQEIDGVGVPANLYTDEFPVVTEPITYYAVFAGKSAEASITTNTLTVTENLGQYKTGTITDDQGAVWNYLAGGSQDLTINLRNNSGEASYLASPKFAGTVQSIVAHVKNGSASERTVYLRSSAVEKPTEGDLGETSIAGNNNSNVALVIADGKSFDQFYIQVSGGLQFKDIVVTSGIAAGAYIDYITSCEADPNPIPGYEPIANPTTLSGVFSVAADKKVQFSTGNLQYEVGTNTWLFASKQYEVMGGAPYDPANPTNTNFGMNVPGYTGKLDLFAWSCDGKYGVNPSNTDSDYQGTFVDWGTLAGEGWFTLTKEEMNYILNRTKNGKKLWALATIDDLPGLILLPDNWNTNITLTYGYIPTQFVYNENLFTAAEWQVLEVAGAVFLPAAGSRTGGYGNKDNAGFKESYDANEDYFHVDNVGIYGYYWLNTQDPRTNFKHCASYLILPGWDEGPTVDEEGLDDLSTHPQVWSREKRRGNSVRLVKTVKEEPTTTVSGRWELVTDASSTLAVGDKVVIAAKDYNYALSTTQKENNRGQAAVTKHSDKTISFTEEVQVLTLEAGTVKNTFAFNTDNGYLYAASSGSNYLRTETTLSNNSSWAIAVSEDGTATIVAKGSNTRNTMLYNQTSSLFACYESASQKALCLYRKTNVKVESNQTTTNDIPNYSDVTVGSTGQLNVDKPLIVENLYIQTTMGAATSAQISNATNTNLLINGDVFIDITLGKNGDPNQWHAFTVPFPVDAMNGVYDINDNKLTNEVNYAIMDYHGDLRANGQYGWKKYRGILVPGTFYLMTVDGARTTYRFKKVEDAAIVAPATKAITAYTGTGDETKDKGWNGVGNPTLMHGKVGYKALILNPETYTYEAITENSAYFTVGTPFFIQAATDGEVAITAEGNSSLAPARRAAAAVENIKVMLGNSDYTDRLYVSASEDAINEYEIGKDLGKMAMTSTPSVVQISALAYDTRLCMIDAPMANNEALVVLNLYAPANGEYTLSIEAQDNEKVYLLHEGTFVWDLSMSEYPITLNKGDNTGYSILVRRADAPTSVETIDGTNNQTEKLIHNGNLYILHNGKVFDAVGSMLK